MNTSAGKKNRAIKDKSSLLPYLDIREIPRVGGETYLLTEEELDIIADRSERYFRQVSKCGTKILKGKKIVTCLCKKQICPKCGGYKRRIHKNKYLSVTRRVGSLKKSLSAPLSLPFPMN